MLMFDSAKNNRIVWILHAHSCIVRLKKDICPSSFARGGERVENFVFLVVPEESKKPHEA